jgi:hypothetical protein
MSFFITLNDIDLIIYINGGGSLGVRDSESCWFTEEIDTYMRCWESPVDLPLVIEIFASYGWSLYLKKNNG